MRLNIFEKLWRGRRVAALVGCAAIFATAAGDGVAVGDAGGQSELKPNQVVTFAGVDRGKFGSYGDGVPARQAALREGELRIDIGPEGTVYLLEVRYGKLRAVGSDGLIDTVANTNGQRSPDVAQDGTAEPTWGILNSPHAVAVGEDGNVYVAGEKEISRIGPDGTMSAIGGGGDEGFKGGGDGGDGGPATAAWILLPSDIDVDDGGHVYVADPGNGRIRRIDPDGTISTVAGGGDIAVDQADGARATDVSLDHVDRIAVDGDGTVYFTITWESAVWKVDTDGRTSTVADLASAGLAAGGTAWEGRRQIYGLAVDERGTLYLADQVNDQIWSVGAGGELSPVGPAVDMYEPDLAVGSDGYLYVAGAQRVVKVAPSGASPLSGGGQPSPAGDDPWANADPGDARAVTGGGDAVKEGTADLPALDSPGGVVVDPGGAAYVCERGRSRLVRVRPGHEDGDVDVVLDRHNGAPVSCRALAYGQDGTVYVATGGQVLKVYPDGAVVSVAGGGAEPGPAEDGQVATTVSMSIADIAAGPDGSVYIADSAHSRVYRLDTDGTMRTVAEFGGELTAGPIDVDAEGRVYLVNQEQDVVNRISVDGSINVFAGGAERPFEYSRDDNGDGGPATAAMVYLPSDVAVGSDGNVYIADVGGIRRVDGNGTIRSVYELRWDEEGSMLVPRPQPRLAVDVHGNLFFHFADPGENVLRVLVRPGDIADSRTWTQLLPGAGAIAVLAVVGAGLGVVVWRRGNKKGHPATGDTG